MTTEEDCADAAAEACWYFRAASDASVSSCASRSGGEGGGGEEDGGSPKLGGIHITWAPPGDRAAVTLGEPRHYARAASNVSEAMSCCTAATADITEAEEEEEEEEESEEDEAAFAAPAIRSEIWTAVSEEAWRSEGLSVVVIGASGDLAKKKTYPSLLDLFSGGLLPSNVVVWGYARSLKTSEEFRSHLRPYLKGRTSAKIVDEFLSRCFYRSGKSYGNVPSYSALASNLRGCEAARPELVRHNRLFYLAVPPNVFGDTAAAVRRTAMELEESDRGWVRLVVEKPFGRDLPSCLDLSARLAAEFDEEHLYRIDHYLGKEMVQNILTMRFGNAWMGHLWHRDAIQSVTVEFKEPFGTEGRGGYFDKFGIIRDVIQNHLLQVLTLLAMEPPAEEDDDDDADAAAARGDASDRIRDAKVKVLEAIPPVALEDCVLGQYVGYSDDPTIEDKGTNCPTYAAVRLRVDTPRWAGVPFLLTAGKALDERRCEARVRFRPPPGSARRAGPPSELVLRLQPGESVSLAARVKSPGFASAPADASLRLDYGADFDMAAPDSNPDAYARLILEVLRGRRAPFVRDDELRRSWEIFTPLLHRIEGEGVRPFMYEMGSGAGPAEAEDFLARAAEGGNGDGGGAVGAGAGAGAGLAAIAAPSFAGVVPRAQQSAL